MGPPGTPVCVRALDQALSTCKHLGVPVAVHKTEGPTTQLTFLGIQIDSEEMMSQLGTGKTHPHYVLSARLAGLPHSN